MFKIVLLILFASIIFCTGLQHHQESSSEEKSDLEEDIYEKDSRQDFDRSIEKEKEQKLLRKAKKLKENTRRVLESILPVKNNETYRRLFEDLINKSGEKYKLNNLPITEVETAVEDEEKKEDSDEAQVEEIEMVVERMAEDRNDHSANKEATELSVTQKEIPLNSKSLDIDLAEEANTEALIENRDGSKSLVDIDTDLRTLTGQDTDLRTLTGQDTSRSAEIDISNVDHERENRILESFPITRFSKVAIPHYRTTLTRSGLMVSPPIYRVHTTAPIIDHVTKRNWIPNRQVVSNIFNRSSNKKVGHTGIMKLIDEYTDYGANAYSYSPPQTPIPPRQLDNKINILAKLMKSSMHPQLENISQFRENLYPGAYYSQHFNPDIYKRYVSFHG